LPVFLPNFANFFGEIWQQNRQILAKNPGLKLEKIWLKIREIWLKIGEIWLKIGEMGVFF